MESWREELYLEHHGIEGQKWGDRNGPPYPLTGRQFNSIERKMNRVSRFADKAEKYKARYEKKIAKVHQAQSRARFKSWAGMKRDNEKLNKKIYKNAKKVNKVIKYDQKAIQLLNKIERIYKKNGLEIPKEYTEKGKQFADDLLARNVEMSTLNNYTMLNNLDQMNKKLARLEK